MITFVFSKDAEKCFNKLDKTAQQRIVKKLKSLKSYPNIFQVFITLVHFSPATHRLRIGKMRLILEQISNNKFKILDIGHRRNIYE